MMPPSDRLMEALLVLLAYAALCGVIAWRRVRQRALVAREAATLERSDRHDRAVIVSYASQTGQAEQLARQTARWLHAGGVAARLLPIAELEPVMRTSGGRALFVVSTTGEGDAPDDAQPFVQSMMEVARPLALAQWQVAVLALGDRGYQHYCAFGRRLDAWLRERGATPLNDCIEVDGMDPEALLRWQHVVGRASGTDAQIADEPDAIGGPCQTWRLLARQQLNFGSASAALMRLDFVPAQGPLPEWAAGDLVELQLPEDPQHPRSYSVASVPSAGSLQIVVRLTQREDGSPGRASGLLCQTLAVGGTARLRLRSNRSFHIGANAGRALLLVGNGSGLAGLRAHLQARAAQEGPPCWLVYGERQQATDAICADETDAWLAQGTLSRLDRVYSRDGGTLRYVQDLLKAQDQALRDWIDAGGAIYVCGSQHGMFRGVDQALGEILGTDAVAALRREGRYRRDVY